jgi:hypothetical protein
VFAAPLARPRARDVAPEAAALAESERALARETSRQRRLRSQSPSAPSRAKRRARGGCARRVRPALAASDVKEPTEPLFFVLASDVAFHSEAARY